MDSLPHGVVRAALSASVAVVVSGGVSALVGGATGVLGGTLSLDASAVFALAATMALGVAAGASAFAWRMGPAGGWRGRARRAAGAGWVLIGAWVMLAAGMSLWLVAPLTWGALLCVALGNVLWNARACREEPPATSP